MKDLEASSGEVVDCNKRNTSRLATKPKSNHEGQLLHHLALLVSLPKNTALEHTTKTTSGSQLAIAFFACVRRNNSPFQRVAVACIVHSKRETGNE